MDTINSLQSEKTETDSIYIQGSVGKLYVEIQRPQMKEGEKLPVVILCHGFGMDCNFPLLVATANDLVSRGIIAIRFDFNGIGKSEGKFQDMTVLNEIDDLKHVIAWVKDQDFTKNISLMGHSQGGVVVSMTSGELPDDMITCEVLAAPAAALRDDAIRGITMGAHYDYWDISGDYVQLPAMPGLPSLPLGKAYIESAVTLPIYETAQNYSGPAFIVHGTHDQVVPYTYSQRFNEKIKDSFLRLIPEEDHIFSKTTPDTANLIADWFESTLMK